MSHRLGRGPASALVLVLVIITAHRALAAPSVLDLDQAVALALASQPLLDAQQARIRAAGAEAVAAGELPDPVLVAGIDDLALTGAHPFSLRNEPDTQFRLGIRQDIPGGKKRALRGARARLTVEQGVAEHEEQARAIARAASLAWIDVWQAAQRQRELTAARDAARRQSEAVAIAYRSGRGNAAEVLAARVALQTLEDELAGTAQTESHARNVLRRWIGADADRPVAVDLPHWPPPDTTALLDQLQHHPHLRAQDRLVDGARAELSLAEADYRPDWSVQIGYGHRPEFSDFASVEIEIGLPVFEARRQDQRVAARLADLDAAEQLRLDWLRQHEAEIQLNVTDWHALQVRLQRYDRSILPTATARLEAALAAYASGAATVATVIEAQRSQIELALQRLDLEYDAARHQIELRYFLHQEVTP